MSILFSYYLFLVAVTVVAVVMHNSSLVADKRTLYASCLVTPPLVLILSALNLRSVLSMLVLLILMVAGSRLLPSSRGIAVTRQDFRWGIGVWLMEALLPLSVHFALRARPALEKWSLIATAILFLAVTLAGFVLSSSESGQTKELNNEDGTFAR
jgi:hypothetical protein